MRFIGATIAALGTLAAGLAFGLGSASSTPPCWAKHGACPTSSTSTTTSTSTTSSTTSTTTPTTTTPAGYPASFYTGPAGTSVELPPLGKAWIGTTPGGSSFAAQKARLAAQQSFIGRPYNFTQIHYSASLSSGGPFPGCYWGGTDSGGTSQIPVVSGREQWAVDNGLVPLVDWSPAWYADEIRNGVADACLRDVASRYAAWGHPFMLRMYWEETGNWFHWSMNTDGTHQTPAQFKQMWQHTVDVMRSAGLTKASFIWAPGNQGSFGFDTGASYPGDNYVDWVGLDSYNHNNSGWCNAGNPGPWCWFSALNWETETTYLGRKPFIVAETGSVEDATIPGRKGLWMNDMQSFLDANPGFTAVSYFDCDMTIPEGPNWQVDTSQSSYDGWKALVLDPRWA